eukprot:gene13161-9007_t
MRSNINTQIQQNHSVKHHNKANSIKLTSRWHPNPTNLRKYNPQEQSETQIYRLKHQTIIPYNNINAHSPCGIMENSKHKLLYQLLQHVAQHHTPIRTKHAILNQNQTTNTAFSTHP